MRRLISRCCTATALAVAALCTVTGSAGAVVNGEPVDPATVPWFASLGSCGGTLVQPDRVLTAAHCVAGRSLEDLPQVVIGNVASRGVTGIALHPSWRHANGERNFLDDVAIVQLDRPVDGVPTVALGGADVEEAFILGRGRPFAPGTGHSEEETFDSTLRGAVLRTISDQECARAFRGYHASGGEHFDARMRCATDADGVEPLYSGCNGDSGGPLWTGTPAQPVQLGIVSWGGDRCGADHLPSVFADVARYRGFIADPTPVWAPRHRASRNRAVHITGRPHPGRRLTCKLSGYASEPGVHVDYVWRIVGAGRARGIGFRRRTVGHGRAYRVARRDRDMRIACFAEASNAGGYIVVGADNRVVR